MTNFNKKMTKAEATKLYNSPDGMQFFPTEHNRALIKSLVDYQLMQLRNNQDECNNPRLLNDPRHPINRF